MEYYNWLIKTNNIKKEWVPYAFLVDEDGYTTDRKKAFFNGIPWEKLVKQKIGAKLIDVDSILNNNSNMESNDGKDKSN